jgi:transposase
MLQSLLEQTSQADPGLVRRLEVLEGPTGRRKWPDALKARIVAETLVPGAKVADVAARHDISAQHLTMWRRLAREGRLVVADDGAADFAPLVISSPSSNTTAPPRWIEIVAGAVTIRVPEDFSPTRVAEIAARLKA